MQFEGKKVTTKSVDPLEKANYVLFQTKEKSSDAQLRGYINPSLKSSFPTGA